MLANTRTLIRSLQNATLDERYSSIEVVNRDPITGCERKGDRGSFSVIFRAFDDATQQQVAIKFFDPSKQGWDMDYRMVLFRREAEAHCGLAHLRELAVYADIYALGCMLHDLFNTDFYFIRLWEDPGFQRCVTTCKLRMAPLLDGGTDDEQLLRHWDAVIRLTRNQVSLPSIATDGTSVPDSARDQLSRLMHDLTAVHYLDRLRDLDRILRMVDSASRALTNQLADMRRRQMRHVRRKRREQRRLENLARLERTELEGQNHA